MRHPFKPDPQPSNLDNKIAELRNPLTRRDPAELARLTAAGWLPAGEGTGEFLLPVWGEEILLPFPDLVARSRQTGREVSPPVQALILYYFTLADGAPLSRRWIAFSELPDGRFYTRAFQGYSGDELARAFGNDLDRFGQAAGHLGGSRAALGDLAFSFQALPRLPLLAAAWQGDEDFAPSYKILFDASAPHYLTTDACAILGGMLARKLVAAK